MRVVAALGGNALLQRGLPLTVEKQRANVRRACAALAPIAHEHELVISHGNGPQVGLLALQSPAYSNVEAYPLDVLEAQTEGMIGYLIMQELGNLLPLGKPLAALLTMIEVDGADPAFMHPTKPIGPVYSDEEARVLAAERGWTFKPDSAGNMRRVVASPRPRQIVGLDPVRWLLGRGTVVICAGGGGIPTLYTDDTAPAGRRLTGVDAVIDKDLASAVLAADLGADALLILTDVDAVYSDWGTPQQHAIRLATPANLVHAQFAEGSMGPKVKAACEFIERGGGFAAIGSIDDAPALLAGAAGTTLMPTPADLTAAVSTAKDPSR